jgi:hypothetical protein
MRECDVHDGGVEYHHQLSCGDDHKGQAKVAMGWRG